MGIMSSIFEVEGSVTKSKRGSLSEGSWQERRNDNVSGYHKKAQS
jgi:hypothetical protein